ncbi:MAG: group III truncated hemoglobin [Flavisolibacter sp.]
MKKDIESREDLVRMLYAFYEQAFRDPLIGHFFTRVVPLDLSTHIPVIADFWESIVFNTRGYRKNVMEVHQHIHLLSAITKEHLDRWVQLFSATVEELFEGPRATLTLQRARSIATMMDIKLHQIGPGKP